MIVSLLKDGFLTEVRSREVGTTEAMCDWRAPEPEKAPGAKRTGK